MKRLFHSTFLLFMFITYHGNAQRISALVPQVSIDSIKPSKPDAAGMSFDPVTGNIFYSTREGEIYELFIPQTGPATDSLRYTVADHGIPALQGFAIHGNTIYLSGNIWSSTTAIGKIVKGVLQSNGSRTWSTIVQTQPYPTTEASGDHGFSGLTISPSGSYIYATSGARTHFGELKTNNGAWPGCREVPMTSRMFKFPSIASNILLYNESSTIENSSWIFATGIRNTFSMDWDGNGNLFGVDNSGDRDDPEEMNWLQAGKNYGFPWYMGGNLNPLINPSYDAAQDPLVNKNNYAYTAGWFTNDPNFTPIPSGISVTEPVRNYGPDADFFRDPNTGAVRDASDEGTYISSFTSHRSPLGLQFDHDSSLAAPFRGDGFLLSFMPGGDSTGYSAISPWGGPCPFVDPVRDLLHVKLTYDALINNYRMNTYRIAEGFYLPVDAELVNNKLYVIERGSSGTIWRVNFPPFTGIEETNELSCLSLFPNPSNSEINLEFQTSNSDNIQVSIHDVYGRIMKSIPVTQVNPGLQKVCTDISTLPIGFYYCTVKTKSGRAATQRFIKL